MIFAEQHHFLFSMPDLSHLELTELYDLLALFTKVYTRILSLSKPPTEDFLFNKENIERILLEIHSRQLRIAIEPEDYIGDFPVIG